MTIAYSELFRQATGNEPYPYQKRLAEHAPAVLDVPTGLGKTEAAVLGWLYRRISAPDRTPRRLFYCLPMRSLVEQTRDRMAKCFQGLAGTGMLVPRVDVVMGGDAAEEWYRRPEEPAVIVGTQDMLLSRALNRGYGMSRYQWPMAFGAANDDAYWVIDEVQLQGIGAVTAAQLHAFRERLGTVHGTEITLVSATLDPEWFETADFSLAGRSAVSLNDDDRAHLTVRRIAEARKIVERAGVYQARDVATLARARHVPGTLTLLVVNRVDRAQEIYQHLAREKSAASVTLLHSRFRPADRASRARELDDIPAGGRIVVATQVVEAGVDISATTLITDVAPWSSLVQRFGRCNRRGMDDRACCIWLDGGEIKKSEALPYGVDDLSEARGTLFELEGESAAPARLPKRPIPLREGLVIRRPEFLDLFDTSRDLAGHDVDVSPYIRDADDFSALVFWRDEPPGIDEIPLREELCAAPIAEIRKLARDLRDAKRRDQIRISNQFARDAGETWIEPRDSDIRPGVLVWLDAGSGWYDELLGFKKTPAQRVAPIDGSPQAELSESCPVSDSDSLSEIGAAVTLTRHAQDTRRHAMVLASNVNLPESLAAAICEAALWHDAGKVHPVFQDTMRRGNPGGDPAGVLAKTVHPARHERRGFRHELPGVLAYLHAHGYGAEANLVAYLIASHHGKLRVAAQQYPYEASCDPFQLLGIRDGEELPSADLGGATVTPAIALSLAHFAVGSADGELSWVERTVGLRDDTELGPFRLAYLELLVRVADWRASEEERG